MILEIVSYAGALTGFIFLVLAIACGLYYVSEMVEERSEPAKRILRRMIQGIMVVYILLWLFDGFPWKQTVFSLVSYAVYMLNLLDFPYVELSSPIFLLLCVLVVSNHFLWFQFFNLPRIPTAQEMAQLDYVPPTIPTFMEVSSFFGVMVWLLPFALFVSLSAHDGMLPRHSENAPIKRKSGLAKALVERCRESMYSISRRLGYELDNQHGRLA